MMNFLINNKINYFKIWIDFLIFISLIFKKLFKFRIVIPLEEDSLKNKKKTVLMLKYNGIVKKVFQGFKKYQWLPRNLELSR